MFDLKKCHEKELSEAQERCELKETENQTIREEKQLLNLRI
jgi:hypothetical protein